MKLTLKVRGLQGLIANFRAKADTVENDVREVVADHGGKVYQRAYDIAPKDTFFMVEHLELVFSPGGYAFNLGFFEEDFLSEGLAFYPPYVEFGTSLAEAQPFLFPAAWEDEPEFMRDLRRVMQR